MFISDILVIISIMNLAVMSFLFWDFAHCNHIPSYLMIFLFDPNYFKLAF